MRNKYPGKCPYCGKRIEAGEGYADSDGSGQFRVWHWECRYPPKEPK